MIDKGTKKSHKFLYCFDQLLFAITLHCSITTNYVSNIKK